VIDGFLTIFGGINEDFQIFADGILPNNVMQQFGAQGNILTVVAAATPTNNPSIIGHTKSPVNE
jgi:hypothetical protein